MKYKVNSEHVGVVKLSSTERGLLNESSRRIPFTALRGVWEAAKQDADNRVQVASKLPYDQQEWTVVSSCNAMSMVSRGNRLDELKAKRDAVVQLLGKVNLMEVAELETIYALEPNAGGSHSAKPPVEPL